MKKTISLFAFALTAFSGGAQIITATFEGFTLAPNSAYSPTTSTPFQTNNAIFQYQWDNAFSYWSGGFAYTNEHDSVTGTFSNLYGVRAFKGNAGSANFAVGQDNGVIIPSIAQGTVNGFYITNTTYVYKTIMSGNSFARKFGDTTGTGSGTTIAQGAYPDYFKLIVKGYLNGTLKNDSVTVMLADYTFTNNAQDFVLSTWQLVNTSTMGEVDSLKFFMRSSDVGQFGVNTPLFFAMDDFSVLAPNPVGLNEFKIQDSYSIYPNPVISSLVIKTLKNQNEGGNFIIRDLNGKMLVNGILEKNETRLDLTDLQTGIYFLEITQGAERTVSKLVKN